MYNILNRCGGFTVFSAELRRKTIYLCTHFLLHNSPTPHPWKFRPLCPELSCSGEELTVTGKLTQPHLYEVRAPKGLLVETAVLKGRLEKPPSREPAWPSELGPLPALGVERT
jgi:hypothetical protein